MSAPPRIILAITGASGAAYGVRALDILNEIGAETHLVVSRAGARTLSEECGISLGDLAERATAHHSAADIGAPIASGSFKTAGMLIAPCSVKSMSEIASGVTGSLVSRAADVALKEKRPLVLMVRETPFHLGHLRTMTRLAEMGATIAPPLPAFYTAPTSVEDVIDQSVGRAIDHLGLDWSGVRRWGASSSSADGNEEGGRNGRQ